MAQLPTVVTPLLDQLLRRQAAARDLQTVQARVSQAVLAVAGVVTTVRLAEQVPLDKDLQVVQELAVAQITVLVAAEADQAPLVSMERRQVLAAQAALVQYLQLQVRL